VSRKRKAAIGAAFGYTQFGLALITGLVLVPVILDQVGARAYGLWLASGEILAHAGVVDFGVLGIVPWLVAEADGGNDRAGMRRILTTGVTLGAAIGLLFGVTAAVLWQVLPSALWLTASDRALVGPPLALLVTVTAIGYPLRAFQAVLSGLQDSFFTGIITVTQAAISAILTIILLFQGYGLWALAGGAAAGLTFGLLASFVRTAILAPDLLRGWQRPERGDVRKLMANGLGAWLGGFGWRLLSATNGVVITYLGHPEGVAIYACTAKVANLASQLSWVLPDNALVGLAHLHGQRQSERVAEVVSAMQRLHLLLAGVAACGVLAFNATFVAVWVGPELFGGTVLNALIAAGIVVASFGHGLSASVSVVGNRLRVGILTVVNGVIQPLLAVYLGHRLGLVGVALAMLVAASVSLLPVGMTLLGVYARVAPGQLLRREVLPWVVRTGPLMALALGIGAAHGRLGFWPSATLTAAITLAYFWQVRPLVAGLPLGSTWEAWVVRLRLAPTAPAANRG